MTRVAIDLERTSREAHSVPLSKINVGDPQLWVTNTHWPYFERLRKEDPVHYCAESDYGPYWSVTKYKDILGVDTNHQVYSSESGLGGLAIRDARPDFRLPMFIAMDPPKHDAQRKVESPIVAPEKLAKLEITIRRHARDPGLPPAQRNLRSGRSRVDRTDDANSGDSLRLVLPRSSQADPMVRHCAHRRPTPQRFT